MNYAKVYREMHERHPKHFSGYSIRPYVQEIANLIFEHQPDRLLDYGSGKGYQYLQLRVQSHWGGMLPHCYDPGVRQLSEKPKGKFGGIICTDVMEHIEVFDVPGVLGDIFSFAGPHAFVFFCIACRPAKRKRLPDGRDVHVTVRKPTWWDDQLKPYKRRGLTIRAAYDEG